MPTVVFTGLRLPEREGEKAAPFTVRCHCGAMLQGHRLAHHQVVRCAQCDAERFILPRSALPGVKAETANSASSVLQAGSWRVWRAPLVGAGLALLVGAIGIFLLVRFITSPEGGSRPPLGPEQQAEIHFQAGENAIDSGSFHQAERELAAALELSPHWPAARRQEAAQLQRQAGIVADLLTEAPAEIIRNSLGVPEAEWQ
ncbi:MAG TPA: hypothetical protein VKS79_09125, partial [Gemmataceae bacterium]|nr:hypothetical protein [Gemmataceae bacterium]